MKQITKFTSRSSWYQTQQDDFFRSPRGVVAFNCYRQTTYFLRGQFCHGFSVRVAFCMLDSDGGRE